MKITNTTNMHLKTAAYQDDRVELVSRRIATENTGRLP